MTVKAVCVTPNRDLELRDVPAPGAPPEGHVVVDMVASAINHGDHTFLKMRSLLGLPSSRHDIWGASGAGRVVAVGPGVPQAYAGKQVAIYRSLSAIISSETVGLWSEQALVHHLSCMILPDRVDAKDYSGSLVNIITAYAFVRQIVEEGIAPSSPRPAIPPPGARSSKSCAGATFPSSPSSVRAGRKKNWSSWARRISSTRRTRNSRSSSNRWPNGFRPRRCSTAPAGRWSRGSRRCCR